MTDAFSKASHGSPLGGLKAQPAWHPTALACGDPALTPHTKRYASFSGDPAASAIPTTTSCVGGPTTFEQLKPLFRQMSPYQLSLTANHLIPHATDLEALTCRKFDLMTGVERHM